MKKLILFSVLSVVFFSAKAQFGVQAGVNISTWHGDDVSGDDVSSIIGFFGGIHYNAKISENFSVAPELTFSSEGTQEEGGDSKVKVGYINLTPLVRFNTQSGFYVGTGPQLGFMVTAKDKESGVSIDIKDALNGFNFSWAFAAGFDFKGGVGIFGRYSLGLTDIIDESDVSAKTGTISFGLKYNIPMGGK